MNISLEHINVFILQTQRSHLPLRLLGGRAVPGSHPAHLQVRLHRVLRVQLQHRADCALRQAAGRPPLPLTAAYQTAAGLTDRLYKPLISLILQTVFFLFYYILIIIVESSFLEKYHVMYTVCFVGIFN